MYVHPVCVFVYPMRPMFYFVLSIRSAFPHPMCHMYIVMSTADLFFFCVICFTLCCPFGLLSSSDLSSALYCYAHPRCGFFNLCVLCFILYCPFGFLFPIRFVKCFTLSYPHVMSSFMPWVLRFILSCAVGARSPILCVICFILSYPSVMCSFIPRNMFSDCSVHPLIWRVLSTRRTKCTITNCLKSAVLIRYVSSQSP